MMLALPVAMFCFVIWYAIYKKGDVRAEISHGKTVFRLEAKERRVKRRGE
jgi:hypothetical protein